MSTLFGTRFEFSKVLCYFYSNELQVPQMEWARHLSTKIVGKVNTQKCQGETKLFH